MFPLSVGRSKALKSQTYSKTKVGEVNWELILKKKKKKWQMWCKSTKFSFLLISLSLTLQKPMCSQHSTLFFLFLFLKCPTELTILFTQQNHSAIHPEMPMRFEVSLEIFQRTPKITTLGLLLHFHFMASFYILQQAFLNKNETAS